MDRYIVDITDDALADMEALYEYIARDILANMDEVEALGSNRNRTYRLKADI